MPPLNIGLPNRPLRLKRKKLGSRCWLPIGLWYVFADLPMSTAAAVAATTAATVPTAASAVVAATTTAAGGTRRRVRAAAPAGVGRARAIAAGGIRWCRRSIAPAGVRGRRAIRAACTIARACRVTAVSASIRAVAVGAAAVATAGCSIVGRSRVRRSCVIGVVRRRVRYRQRRRPTAVPRSVTLRASAVRAVVLRTAGTLRLRVSRRRSMRRRGLRRRVGATRLIRLVRARCTGVRLSVVHCRSGRMVVGVVLIRPRAIRAPVIGAVVVAGRAIDARVRRGIAAGGRRTRYVVSTHASRRLIAGFGSGGCRTACSIRRLRVGWRGVFTWPFGAVPLKVGRVILLLAAPATLDVPVVPWLMAFMLPCAIVAWFAASRFAGRLVAVVPRLAVTTPRLVAEAGGVLRA